MRSLPCIACFLLLLICCASARGHEFWIEPSTWTPEPGAIVRVELRHGERFRGDRVTRRDELIERFALVGDDGEAPIHGRSGGAVSFARAERRGAFVIGYRSRRVPHDLDADAFERYLAEEGLDRISALRAQRGERDRPGREVYSRCAKSIVTVGEPDGGVFDRVLGFPLEIVIENDPRALAADARFSARVLHDGTALAGAAVVAVHAGDPDRLVRAMTDAEGRVELTIDRPGAWMLTTIHMVDAPDGVDADWESFWASTTFQR